ncbi:MAG: peptidoglycan DD-metalloendopeptidase family protein [Clostridia bacterium]|nr:peptidoglycan DD-metalloendopeptidase family protein [Clostridia bacterium]
MRKRKIVAFALTLILCVPVCITKDNGAVVYGLTVQEKINNASKEKQEALDKINKAEEQKKDIVAQSKALDMEIGIVQDEINAIDTIIDEANAEIKLKEEEIAEHEARIEEQNDEFKRVLRFMDETSTSSYLELLLSSKSFSEFFANVETINEITKHDTAIIDEMISLKNSVEEALAAIEAEKNVQEEARKIASQKQNTLQAKLDEKAKLTKQLESDIEQYKKVYDQARKEEEALKASLSSSLSNSSTSKYTGGKFCWPAPSYTRISSPYGYRIHPIFNTKKFHSGVDLAAPGGTNILAATDGTVKMAGWNGGYGNCVVVDHGGGVSTLYGHASKLLVSKGEKVTRGQVIAKVGTTGNSTGNHLHFEVLINGKTTDPMAYIQ